MLSREMADGKLSLKPRDIAQAVRNLGFGESAATAAADAVAALSDADRRDSITVARALWSAYAETTKSFRQSAHVILARALLYRIGEDQGVFPRLLGRADGEGIGRLIYRSCRVV